MEFHIPKSSSNKNYQDSFDFGSEELANIPCPDDMCMEMEGSADEEEEEEEEEKEDDEILLPPGTTRDDFPDLLPLPGTSGDEIPKFPQFRPSNTSNDLFPSFSQNQALDNTSKLLHCESEDFNILPLSDNTQQTPNVSTNEFQEDVSSKIGDFLDDSKYSPSKADSDDENQDSITVKPKVLGKEQAKKRLMAFSLSKLPSVSIKKQNKLITPVKNKEKPPNPNKGSNVQEQFRATISAIEEEKKIMLQSMRGYLPNLEKSELAKSSQSSLSSSFHLLEKNKSDNVDMKSKDNSGKDGSTANKSSESKSKRSYRRSRSRSKGRKPDKRRSKRNSRSRTRRSRSRGKRSYSRRSRERNYKSENKTACESQSTQKKKSAEDWDRSKAAGVVVESESFVTKSRSDNSKSRRDEHHKRSRSPNGRPEYKPIFNYLTKNSSPMTSLQARPADSSKTSGSSAPVFSEKIIKYTRTKPILCWSENPSHATEFYMSKQMLLENCDEATASIVLSIVERKNLENNSILVESKSKSRSWYPSEDYLMPFTQKHSSPNIDESQPLKKAFEEENVEKQNEDQKEASVREADSTIKPSFERKISLVNDSYLSDEEEHNKMTLEDTKVLLNVHINQVKVRSKWDSDYEGDASEKDIKEDKEKTTLGNIKAVGLVPQTKDKLIDDFDVAPCNETIRDCPVKKKMPLTLESSKPLRPESPSSNVFNGNPGNLVSEYEEFLKMVSVDSSDVHDNEKDKISKESKKKKEKPKVKKLSKVQEEVKKLQSPKLGITDWDQESDREEKSNRKKIQFSNSEPHDEFSILRKSEVIDVTFERTKKKLVKKKNEKESSKKKKLLKKSSKTKKKKFENSASEDESSTESDSDSDSDESISSKSKKKKKKISKAKKKSKKESSSESDSDDSDNSREIKKKSVKKKGKKKKSSSSSSSVDNGEVQKNLLKELDFKKQLVMKKMEDIDSVSDKGAKKKDSRGRKKESSNDTDSEKHVKVGKKKKLEIKVGKRKKESKSGKKAKLLGKSKKLKKSKSSSESESDSDSSDENTKKKKVKKSGNEKRKRYTSGSSDSDQKVKSKFTSKIKKEKKIKRDSSASEPENSDSSSRERKKLKKGKKIKSGDEKVTELSFKDDLLLDKPEVKSEEGTWDCKKSWKGKSRIAREGIDWETSSSSEESKEDRRTRESSWDEEPEGIEKKIPTSIDAASKIDKRKPQVVPEKESSVNNSTNISDPSIHLSSEALKTSLSNFSFNENSFCSFGQELSRDFFLAERSFSNPGFLGSSDTLRQTLIEPRPFQSVSRDSESKKPTDSELYSPGYSDSDLSESEMCKPEKDSNISTANVGVREDVYDPLNCDSEGSGENNEVEVSSIPLPHVPNTSFPVAVKTFENASSNSEGSAMKDFQRMETDISGMKMPCMTPPTKSTFMSGDFTLVSDSRSPFTDEKLTPTKRQVMSVKGQQKLVSKAAAVFQDESDEENIEPPFNKEKSSDNAPSETSSKGRNEDDEKRKISETRKKEEKEKDRGKKRKKESRDRSRERSNEKENRKRRSRSRESSRTRSKKAISPMRKKSKTPEMREKREIRSDSFEIEPLKSSIESGELTDLVQPIPVLTGLEPSSEGLWPRPLVSSCDFTSDNLIDHAESFDIYPSEETNFWDRNYERNVADRDKSSMEKPRDHKTKKERRKSRSRSYSPRKKLRSKSPERRKSPRSRSPRKKSVSPKRRDKSPFSPRRRSPKSRRYKISRSPDKKKKSSSRSPRKRRGSPPRRSRSSSPRKYRSPKYREESPRRKESSPRNFSPRDRFSPRKDVRYPQTYPDNLQNRIPVIGTSNEGVHLELSPSAMSFPRHMPDSSVTDPELYSSFYESEYTNEFGGRTYPEDVGVNNLITVQSHDGEKPNSPERLSLDQRIELELGVQMSGGQTQSDPYQVCPPFQDMNQTHFQNSYTCDNTNMSSENFYQNQNVQMNTDFNGQYFNGHQQQPPPNYGSFQQYPSTQPAQNSVLQVGNIVEVVPMLQHPPPPHPVATKTPQIMQVGNVLQVVPSPKATPPVSSQAPHTFGPPEASPLVKTQKATAVVAPSPAAPTPNPEAVLNPLIKAIQLEREKRRKEKEKRKLEREARRKARQLRREAKLMSVNEKLKKSVQDEGLMLGQEVEDEELLDGLDVPSPPIPVEIITVSTISPLPPAGKGILITAGFMPKPPSEKKEVKFADGVCPGEGTSTSGGEDIASPPPKPKLPKEKRFKKKKTKVKKKVKVQIIRQIIQEDDDEDDDLSPPPPPPGDPPLVFFAKFPFAGDAQFPVYQTQTTTTTLTTVQYPAQTFE